jgi:hypothetical protein
MERTINFKLPLSFSQLVDLVKQLPEPEKKKLVSVLQDESNSEENSKSQILDDLKADLNALKKGKLETRPLQDVINEL